MNTLNADLLQEAYTRALSGSKNGSSLQ